MNSGFASIIGRSNVGKSTLLNQLVGEKIAAVSPRPQTTRNRILGVRSSAEGQIVFIDTPGIHKPFNKMHQRMVNLALSALQGVDVLLLMVDAAGEFGQGDRYVLDLVKQSSLPAILALNKIDLISKERLLPLIQLYNTEHGFRSIVPISALTGDGLQVLEREILAALPEGRPVFSDDVLTDQPDRSLASEIIREKVFILTRREVPYCTAVTIDLYQEEEDRLLIAASIVVEHESQKGIVIGKGGGMLKKIGTAARKELEEILNTHIYLDLRVKVKKGWREDERFLRDLGLT
jgi:GTP-binding protein Era